MYSNINMSAFSKGHIFLQQTHSFSLCDIWHRFTFHNWKLTNHFTKKIYPSKSAVISLKFLFDIHAETIICALNTLSWTYLYPLSIERLPNHILFMFLLELKLYRQIITCVHGDGIHCSKTIYFHDSYLKFIINYILFWY